MCKECGCGGELSHESHGHGMDVHVPVLDANDRLAERNRGFFAAKNLLVINVFSSPGSGKTSLLQKTAEMLRGRVRMGVIVGDLATDNDAERLSRADIPVVQITTGTMCHLDARMIAEAMKKMPLDDLDVLIIENVGNLVCPASYDLGEGVRVVLLSVTEGEDKPLKYPPMFHSADVALVTKSDLADAVDFNRDAALSALNKVAHHAHVIEVSSKTGEGMEAWCEEIVERARRAREGTIQHHGHHHH
ncbi:hydrogenase accessory protein HypB [Akkermansia muciniphila]|uniref:Hydrogenase accessory protein HypB n=2 Tax=Akkermansia muciniphila TaxID=239935 RepID=A0AAP8NNI4_9BACT|nr:hydrogenase accessory protein HypB [Akkermansia muciniphila]